MAFNLVDSRDSLIEEVSEEKQRILKHARERLDVVAKECGVKWLIVQQMAVKLTGKSKGLSLGECNKLIKEIKNVRYTGFTR